MAKRPAPTEYLTGVPLFANLSKRELRQVLRAGDEVDIEAGREIVTEGRVGREFFLIIGGDATVRRGKRAVARLGPGDHFGELALLHRGPRSATVVADTDMHLFVLPQREFGGLIESMPGLASKLLTCLADRLREVDAKTLTY